MTGLSVTDWIGRVTLVIGETKSGKGGIGRFMRGMRPMGGIKDTGKSERVNKRKRQERA